MTPKALVQQSLNRLGYRLTRTPVEGSIDRELQRVLVDRKVTTVLDIGAHVGAYGQRLRDIGFRGRIVSFEPSPRPFGELQSRASGAWEVMQLALGDRTGTAELHVYAEHEEFTSLRWPSDYGRENFGLTLAETVSVPVRRLDDVVNELDIDVDHTLVKIDTQGHDVAVVDGAPDLLRSAAALQLEIPMFGLYEAALAGTTVIQRVLDLGFDLVGMFPVHDHPRPLVPVEFDGLFARDATAG